MSDRSGAPLSAPTAPTALPTAPTALPTAPTALPTAPTALPTSLKALGLTALAGTVSALLDQARQQEPTYDVFLAQALEAELAGRAERAHARRLRAARLPARKTLDGFDFSFQPSVPERLIRELASLNFLETATNVLFLGPPGVGKTHLASALAAKALDAGHSVLFTTLAGLAEALEGSPSPTAWRQRLRRYVQPRILVIDEVGYTRLTAEQAHALLSSSPPAMRKEPFCSPATPASPNGARYWATRCSPAPCSTGCSTTPRCLRSPAPVTA